MSGLGSVVWKKHFAKNYLFKRERCGIAGIFGDFQRKAAAFLCS